ncbi:putative nucleoside-diphosphate-sugar epimerase [Rickettsia prowazekii str. GvV257]|uniref:mitochondrial fission ELM1 family protein n=1 Tax=Rickettsia prowazekii TaxID=782 RepID=UPI000256C4A2|nr:mitochondrial fission ELM1 family protein [Rickettsia prowazekii]AFE52569.1 putative nucleoside-diphosphate-sugar epimerase [Rickettsia prowazekii str. GvV257]AFE53140.1 putative nucleoside-diphosphate-sugar epimerase [Rickettsia prowazekii str. RpGvF24]EOB10010.1 hypothetical protein H376_5220 [Rickettsia prowazekii str. GvF12]
MNIWVIADDRTGNTHQAIALAAQLTGKYTTITLEYNFLAKLPNFLLQYYPIHVKRELLQDIIDKLPPDMIITAGRRTAVLAFYLKKKFENIKLVQIMQPNLPYNIFDAIILPYHDYRDLLYCGPAKILSKNIKSHCKVLNYSSRQHDIEKMMKIIPINGALNNITAKFSAASLELQKHYPHLKQFTAVIIGGNNKRFSFNEDIAILFSSLLNKIYSNQAIPFFISFSRRTPQIVKSIIKNNTHASTMIYDPSKDTDYNNPYIDMLANAKYIISTADSISMCSEAASSGKPLYIFYPPNFNSLKHKIFIEQLVEQKIARIFNESITMLEEYSYKPLNEAKKVAEIIKFALKINKS